MSNFQGIHSVSIKVRQSPALDSIPTAHRFVDAFIKAVDAGDTSGLTVHPQDSLETMQRMLKEHFGDSISFRDGVSQGCYGSTTGETFNGFTAYVDAVEFPDRFTNNSCDEYTEWFNPLKTMSDAGWRLVTKLDEEGIDELFESLEESGETVKHDNTYNQSGMSETVVPLYDVDFKVIERDSGLMLVAAMFHHGGDPRGNYGSRHLFVVKDNEEFFEGLCPSYWGEES